MKLHGPRPLAVHLHIPPVQLPLQQSALVVHATLFGWQHCDLRIPVSLHGTELQQSALVTQAPDVAEHLHSPPVHVPLQQSPAPVHETFGCPQQSSTTVPASSVTLHVPLAHSAPPASGQLCPSPARQLPIPSHALVPLHPAVCSSAAAGTHAPVVSQTEHAPAHVALQQRTSHVPLEHSTFWVHAAPSDFSRRQLFVVASQ